MSDYPQKQNGSDAPLSRDPPEEEYRRSDVDELKMDAGKLGMKSILQEAERLSRLYQVELPEDLFAGLGSIDI